MRTLADRRNEEAKADADDRELESRSDRRRQQDERENMLKSLATRLVALKSTALDRLGLDDEIRAAITEAQAIRSAPARNRQVNVVRQHLRSLGVGADAVLRQLDAPTRTGQASVPPAPRTTAPSAQVLAWSERLAESGDEALEELLLLHPSADRQLLRQRTRELSRARATAHGAALARSEERLRAALATWVDAPGDVH